MKNSRMATLSGSFVALTLLSALGSASAHENHVPQPKAKAMAQTSQATTAPDLDVQFRAALAAGDAQRAASLLSEDVLIYEGGGVERSKAEYASHHLGGDIAFSQATQFTLGQRNVRVFGDIAIATSESRTTGRYRDRDLNLRGTETMIMRKEREQWRIIHIHWSSKNGPTTP